MTNPVLSRKTLPSTPTRFDPDTSHSPRLGIYTYCRHAANNARQAQGGGRGGEGEEEDPTPQPPSKAKKKSVSQATTASQVDTGGLSAPLARQQMRLLSMAADGFVYRDINLMNPDLPKELHKFLEVLFLPSIGEGVISEARKSEIKQQASHLGGAKFLPRPWAYTTEADRDVLGPTPSVEQVLDIMSQAMYCLDFSFDEAAWNSLVHSSLLQLALYGGGRRLVPKEAGPAVSVGFTPYTIVSILVMSVWYLCGNGLKW